MIQHTLRKKALLTFGVLTLVKVLILLIICISPVLALDLDDRMKYNSSTDTITLKNAFGIGQDIIKYTKTSNTNQCLIDCNTTHNIELLYDGMLLEGVKIYDVYGREISLKEVKVYEWIKKTNKIEVDNATITCKNTIDIKTGNKTEECTSDEKTKFIDVDASYWEEYDYGYRKAGNHSINIVVKKKPTESVDWSIVMKGGKETKEYWAWFNSSWKYKQQINITDTSGELADDYVIHLNIPYDANMSTNFSDLRFTNRYEDTELSYYLEDWKDSTNASVFVKLKNVTASGVTPIYMYYGNSLAPSTSSGANTFYFFDSFEYNDLGDDGGYTEGNGQVSTNYARTGSKSVRSTGTSQSYRSLGIGSYTLSYFAHLYISETDYHGTFGARTKGDSSYGALVGFGNGVAINFYTSPIDSAVNNANFTRVTGRWNFFKITTNSTYGESYLSNWTAVAMPLMYRNQTGNSDSRLDAVSLYKNNQNSNDLYLDDIAVYRDVMIKPTWVFSGEMEAPSDTAPIVTQNNPINYYNSTTNSITFNCTAEDNIEITNMTLYINSSINEFFNRGSTNRTSFQTSKTLNDALYNWSCNGVDNLSVTTTSSTRYFTIDTIKPAVSIVAPLNNNIYGATQTTLNYSVYDLHNSSCWITNETTTTYINCTLTNWTITSHEGWNNITLYANDSFGWQNQTSTRFQIDTTTPTLNITYPNNETYYYVVTALNYTYAEVNPSLCWYSTNNGASNTSITCGQNVTGLLSYEGNNTWHTWINDTFGRIASSNVTFMIDAVPPIVILYEPVNASNKIVINGNNYNTNLNYSASDLHLDTCWYSSDYNTSNTSFTCNTLVTIPYTTLGSHYINYYANDSNSNITAGATYFSIYQSNYTQAINSNSTLEGMEVIFYLNVTTSSNPTTTAKLTYNNVAYTPDTSEVRNQTNIFIHHLDLPAGSGNSTGKNVVWFWNYTLATLGSVNTSENTLKVYSVEIDNCSLYTLAIMNVSLLDEETNTLLVANTTKIEADISLRLPTGSVVWNLNQTYYNVTKLSFCTPSYIFNYSDFKLYSTFGYDGTLYTNEFYYIDGKTISSTDIPILVELRDLLLSDSTSFLFFFQNEYNLKKANVVVEILRNYIGDGLFRIAEREKTDDNGQTNVHLVEEDVIYRFKIYEDENLIYTSTDYKAVCQQIPCELTLRQKPDSLELGENGLIPYSFHIEKDDATRELSVYFNLDSTETMNLTLYEINYSSNRYIPIVSEIKTASSGVVTATLPVSSENKTIAYRVLKSNDTDSDSYVDAGEVTFSSVSLRQILADLVWLFVILIVSLFVGISVSEGVLHFVLIGVAFMLLTGLSLLSLWATIPLLLILMGVVIWYHKYKNE